MPQAKKSWRLSKTLSRNVSYNPIELDDLKWAWAAYKQGELPGFDPGMDRDKFIHAFEEKVINHFHGVWALTADVAEYGHIPVGFAFGFWFHPAKEDLMVLNSLVWLPWATPRKRLETTVKFFATVRKTIKMLGFARKEDKSFFETLAKHGIVRRIGTSHTVFNDGPATVWETR